MIGHSLTLLEDDGGWDFPECSCGWIGPPCPDKEIASEFWADHCLTAVNDEDYGGCNCFSPPEGDEEAT